METNLNKENNSINTNPLIFILGPTGIGKTKISLALANKLNGEIINSDAFNIYKGADVMIAKASNEERRIVKHHLIDIVDLNETNYSVLDYCSSVGTVIDDIIKRKKLPIIVGGTNYYVDSILFEKVYNNLIENKNLSEDDFIIKQIKNLSPELENFVFDVKSIINNLSYNNNIDLIHTKLNDILITLNEKLLHKILEIIDPQYFTFLHKNDIRKIKNGIIYYFILNKKKSTKLSKELIKLKYPNSFIIYLNPFTFDQLQKRIENRIEEMLIHSGGLLEIFYILNYFESIYKDKLEEHFTEGVLQAIGYKEFYPLYKIFSQNNIENSNENIIKECLQNNKTIFDECVNKLKSNTIKYAKTQNKFISKRILSLINPNNIMIIEIKEFINEKYEEYINSAYDKIQNYLNNLNDNINLDKEVEIIKEKINKIKLWQKYKCDICNIEMNGEAENKDHFKSNKHKNKKRNILKGKRIENNIININLN